MAAPTAYVYDKAKEKIANGTINLSTHQFKLALLTTLYSPSKSNDGLWSEISANESSGAGYTAGGWALTETFSRTGATVKLDAADFVVTGLNADWRYAVVYDDTNVAKDLLLYLSPGSPQVPGGLDYIFSFNINGLLTLTDG